MLYRDDDADDSPPRICLTDVNEVVLQRCAENMRLSCNISSAHPRLSVRPLDWTDAVDPGRALALRKFAHEFSPDVILGADVLYLPDIIPALLSTVALALIPKRATSAAYLALTVRNEDLFQNFLSSTDGYGLVVECVPDGELDKSSSEFVEACDGMDQNVQIVRLTLRDRMS